MRLKSLYISQYKNLRDFSLSFDGSSFVDVFVGKNGTGKSNLFEALTEILHHVDQIESADNTIEFEYKLIYEIDDQMVEIEWKDNKLSIGKDSNRKSVGKTPFPDCVLVYYSGHNPAITSIIDRYERSFRRRIKGANIDETRRFIGIGPEYKALLLAVLLTSPANSKARRFIQEKLSIAQIGHDMSIQLCRPGFSDGRLKELGYGGVEAFDSRSHYWGADGITREFLDKLAGCIKSEFSHANIYNRKQDYYSLKVNLELFTKAFEGIPTTEIFRNFDNLKTLGMLAAIDMELSLNNGKLANVTHFSDGQFQSVYIYSITELYKDRNCLTLLDEPDSFLHPEWQFDFLKQVFEITDAAMKKNHVLMSSHSAVTLISHEKKRVNLFDIHNSNVVCRSTSKDYAISKLSSSLIKYREDEQILSILRNIRIEGAPVLFTEGSTDPDILKEAWRKLFDEPLPFVPIYAFCCDYLRRALQDNRIINEMGGRPLFGLFDFDEAYNEWNYLNKKDSWTLQCDDPYLGLRTENTAEKVHAFILPVPRIAKVEEQVIKIPGLKEHFAHQAIMGIEHLFYSEQTAQYFKSNKLPGGGEVVIFSGNKTKFAREVVPILDVESFEVFRPMLDFIRSKCPAPEGAGAVAALT